MTTRSNLSVSKVVEYKRDIRGKRFVKLYAGVGAGKNFWAKELYKQGLRVLLITSRAATAAAQCKRYSADRKIDIWKLSDTSPFDEDGEDVSDTEEAKKQRFVICTNTHIEKFVRHKFKRDDPKTHIWNKFDVIILDEGHSLAMDATFSESVFYVDCFLRYAYKHSSTCDIVVMSGTIEPSWWLGTKQARRPGHTIDCFQKCIHHEPQKVIFYPKQNTFPLILQCLERGERIVYFSNTIEGMARLAKQLLAYGLNEDKIAISFAGDETDVEFPEKILLNKGNVEHTLVTTEYLPPNIKIFLTTSKNKEGISIQNTNFNIVFAESHIHSDLVQMAGRIRHDISVLYVPYDSAQHYSASTYVKEELSAGCVEAVNAVANSIMENVQITHKEDRLQEIVKTVENMFPAIRYDYLAETFRLYRGRIFGERQTREDKAIFSLATKNFDSPCNEIGQTGYDILKEWFPYSQISMGIELNYGRSAITRALLKFLKEKNWLGTVIDASDREAVADKLRELILIYGESAVGQKTDFKSLGPALKKFRFKIQETKSHDTNHYIIDTLWDVPNGGKQGS